MVPRYSDGRIDWQIILEGMSPTLRGVIIHGLVERDTIRRRLRWRPSGQSEAGSDWWAGEDDR